MSIITSEAQFRQRVLKYSLKYGVTKASNRFGRSRQAILVRVIRKWVQPEIQKRTARKNKPYARAEYAGQKVQVDVKFVPSYCVTNGQKYYQYTAVDECTRWTYREMYNEHSTYTETQWQGRTPTPYQ